MLGQPGSHQTPNHSPVPPRLPQSWSWCRTPSSQTPTIRAPGSITAGCWGEVSGAGGGWVFRARRERERTKGDPKLSLHLS